MSDILADHEPQADALLVQTAVLNELCEVLEKVLDLSLGHTHTGVLHCEREVIFFSIVDRLFNI